MPETHPKPTHEAPSATQAALVLRRWLHSEQVESPTLGPAHDGYRTIEAVLELTISRVDKGPIEQRLVWGAVPIKLHLGMGEEDENKLLKSTAVKKFMTTGKPFLIDFCRKDLADYKRPRKITFVAELPRNPTGKILKRELKEMS